MMLRLLGDEARTAPDAVEAVEADEPFCPQVILMGVGMPRLNGLVATRRIREQSRGRDVTIIALTGWGRRATRSAHGRRGATAISCDQSACLIWSGYSAS